MDTIFGLLFAIIFLVLFVAFVVGLFQRAAESFRRAGDLPTTPAAQKSFYSYSAKDSLMTQRETKFYWFLVNAFEDDYYIFPQVHLSSLVKSTQAGKVGWRAFLHINGKSVDYVLCDRTTLRPICAIELDDWTHQRKSRVERDREVERILEEARMPLVRISNPDNVDMADFRQYLADSNEKRGIVAIAD